MAHHFAALTKYQMAWEIDEWNWEIGEYTYGRPTVLEPELAQLRIGNFCSIGPNVTLVLGNHSTDLVTTYPFAVLKDFWDTPEDCMPDHSTKGDIVIHNDVWLGAGSIVLSGVEIGTGAVIAAHSVVKDNIPPYAIVAGNPARVVKYRFTPEIRERLLRTQWWSWNKKKIQHFLPLILHTDIEAFLRAVENTTHENSEEEKTKNDSTLPS